MALFLGNRRGRERVPGGGRRRARARVLGRGEGGAGEHLDRSRGRARQHPRRRGGGAGGGGGRSRRRARARCWGSPAPTCRGGGAAGRPAALRARRGSRRDAVVALKGALGDDGRRHGDDRHGLGLRGAAGGRGADDRRLGVPARRPGQRRAHRAGRCSRRRCSPMTGWRRRRRCSARCWPSPAGRRRSWPSGSGRARRTSPARRRACSPPAAAGDAAARAILARGGGGGGAARSTGCRRRARCRSASWAGSGRNSPRGSAPRYGGLIRPPRGQRRSTARWRWRGGWRDRALRPGAFGRRGRRAALPASSAGASPRRSRAGALRPGREPAAGARDGGS